MKKLFLASVFFCLCFSVYAQASVLNMGTVPAVITSASDSSQPNLIAPDNMNGVSEIKKAFTFSSGAASHFYFDPTWSFGLCSTGPNGQYPVPQFILTDGTTRQVLIVQYPFSVVPNKNYTILFELDGVNCSDAGFEAAFGLRRER